MERHSENRPRRVSVVLATTLLLRASGMVAAPIDTPVTTTFDESLEGWSIPPEQLVDLIYMGAGGNPGGFALFGETNPTATEIEAPPVYLGDWSELDGVGRLQFDHKILELGELPDGPPYLPYEAVITGGANRARFVSAETAVEEWNTVTVPIEETEWSIEKGTWSELLTNVESLRIRIELVANPGSTVDDQDGIDNVSLMGAMAGLATGTPDVSVSMLVEPNPFRARTAVVISGTATAPVRVALYDTAGRRVSLLFDGVLDAGAIQRIVWDGRDAWHRVMAPGVYLVRIVGRDIDRTQKIVRIE